MTTLFQQISDQLVAKVPNLAVVDLNTGQLNRFCETSPIATPAVLLKFSSPNIEEIDSSQDIVPVQVSVAVIIDNTISETSSITPAPWRQQSLDKLAVINKVARALRGFYTDEITNLTRVSSVPEDRNDCLYVHNITFTGNYLETF